MSAENLLSTPRKVMELESQEVGCRLCFMVEPRKDLLNPCKCRVHRKCLDRWRTVSPYVDAVTHCDYCNQPYRLRKRKEKPSDCCNTTTARRLRFGTAVAFDMLAFISFFIALWIALGFLGDVSFNSILERAFHCPITNYTAASNVSGTFLQVEGCRGLFHFTEEDVWSGRVWFWGFVVTFFILGIVGCCFFCCCREKGKDHPSTYQDRGDCYYVCCGPTYYNNYYYDSPYGYWNSSDILCCWLCLNQPIYHHHHSMAYTQSTGSGCECDCGWCRDCNCEGFKVDGDAGAIFLVVVLVVVLIVVVCGVVFTFFISLMAVSKIIKRHLYLLDKKVDVMENELEDCQAPPSAVDTVVTHNLDPEIGTSSGTGYY